MERHPVKTVLALLVCLGLFTGWNHGRGPVTYYVNSSTGSDSNTGTSPSQAWASLTKTNGFLFHSGDTIALNGTSTFNGSMTVGQANAPANLTITSLSPGQATISSGNSSCITAPSFQWISVININCQGSGGTVAAVDGILLTSYLGLVLGGPTISNNTITGYGNSCIDVFPVKGGYTGITILSNTISDCAGKNSTGPQAQEIGCVEVIFSGQSNSIVINRNRISNCHGNNTGHSNQDAKGNGIEINGGIFATVSNNYIHDFGAGSDACGGPVGVLIANSSATTVAFNEVFNGSTSGGCDGDALDFDQGTQNSIMEYNYVHHNTTTGLLGGDFGAVAVANLTYRFNIIEASNGEAGIQINCNTFVSNSCTNIQIYNNTIWVTNGNADAIQGVQSDSASFVSYTIANNLMYVGINAVVVNVPVKPTGTLGVTGNDWFTANNNGGATMALQDGVITANNLGQAQNNGYETTPPGSIPPTGTRVGTAVNPGLNGPGTGGTCNGYLPPCPMGYQLSIAATGTVKGQGLNLTSIYGSNVGVQDFYGNALTAGSLPIGAAANR